MPLLRAGRSEQGKRIKTRQRGGTRRAATSRRHVHQPVWKVGGVCEAFHPRNADEMPQRGHFRLHFRFDALAVSIGVPSLASSSSGTYCDGDFGKAEDRFSREREEESPNTTGRDAA